MYSATRSNRIRFVVFAWAKTRRNRVVVGLLDSAFFFFATAKV